METSIDQFIYLHIYGVKWVKSETHDFVIFCFLGRTRIRFRHTNHYCCSFDMLGSCWWFTFLLGWTICLLFEWVKVWRMLINGVLQRGRSWMRELAFLFVNSWKRFRPWFMKIEKSVGEFVNFYAFVIREWTKSPS